MALELNGTTGVSLVQDGVVTAADLASTLDLSGKTVTLANTASAMVLLQEGAASATEVSSIDIPLDVSGDYFAFRLILPALHVVNNGQDLYARVRDASTGSYKTAGTAYTWSVVERNAANQAGTQSNSDDHFRLCWYSWANASAEAGATEMIIMNNADASQKTSFTGQYSGQDNAGDAKMTSFGGMCNSATQDDYFRLYAAGGNIVIKGGYKLYGYLA